MLRALPRAVSLRPLKPWLTTPVWAPRGLPEEKLRQIGIVGHEGAMIYVNKA